MSPSSSSGISSTPLHSLHYFTSFATSFPFGRQKGYWGNAKKRGEGSELDEGQGALAADLGPEHDQDGAEEDEGFGRAEGEEEKREGDPAQDESEQEGEGKFVGTPGQNRDDERALSGG